MFKKGHKISKVNQGNAEINGPDTCPQSASVLSKTVPGASRIFGLIVWWKLWKLKLWILFLNWTMTEGCPVNSMIKVNYLRVFAMLATNQLFLKFEIRSLGLITYRIRIFYHFSWNVKYSISWYYYFYLLKPSITT